MAVIIVLCISFYFLRKKYYIRSSVIMFLDVILFWAIINYFTSYGYGVYSVEFLTFSNSTLAPTLIGVSLVLFIFGVYRLIRKRLVPQKTNY